MENRVKLLRQERKLNQAQLGDSVGLSQQTVSRIERDYTKMTVDTLVRLSSYFGVTADYLLGVSDKRWGSDLPVIKKRELERFHEIYQVYRALEERDREVLYQVAKTLRDKK